MIGKMLGGFIVLLTGTAVATAMVTTQKNKKEKEIIKIRQPKQTYEEYVRERKRVERLMKR